MELYVVKWDENKKMLVAIAVDDVQYCTVRYNFGRGAGCCDVCKQEGTDQSCNNSNVTVEIKVRASLQ